MKSISALSYSQLPHALLCCSIILLCIWRTSAEICPYSFLAPQKDNHRSLKIDQPRQQDHLSQLGSILWHPQVSTQLRPTKVPILGLRDGNKKDFGGREQRRANLNFISWLPNLYRCTSALKAWPLRCSQWIKVLASWRKNLGTKW